MITVLICGGVWLLGAIATFVLSAILDVKEDGTREEPAMEPLLAISVFWPVVLVVGGPIIGVAYLRHALGEWISARRKRNAKQKQEPKLRIQPTSKELDYRTMPCISCGHTVEKEPHEREARSSTL